MIDIHTHILPGLDDGATHIEMSVQMARNAVAEGITELIATPHHANGHYSNLADDVTEAVFRLNNRLQLEEIDLRVFPGQEIRIHNDILEACDRGELLTLAGTSYMLIEMPGHTVPEEMANLVYELKLIGVNPIIAHPERNLGVMANPGALKELLDQGATAQVTADALLGGFGERVQKAAWSLCRGGLIHFVSSDAHNTGKRTYRMQEAYGRIEAELGTDWADYYRNNATCVVRNVKLGEQPPSPKGPGLLGKLRAFFAK